jgi:sugar phosphate isomerase/epimerase
VSRVTQPATDVSPAVSDFTFSFNCLPEVPLEERFAAARAAGFTDVGISIRWLGLWLNDGHDLDEFESLLKDNGLRLTELEAVRVMQEAPDPKLELAAVLADRFRPARLQSVAPYAGSLDDAAARSGAVADQFAEWGVDVVLEPLPFTNMQTPADAAAIILRADRPNLSMCMDVWHLYRMGLSLDHLDGLWPYISTVQFNDGTIESQLPDDLLQDCLVNRLVPGQGEFALAELVRQRNAHRPDSTFSIEVISSALHQQDSFTTARQIADGIEAVLAASR